jgi:cytochrome b561
MNVDAPRKQYGSTARILHWVTGLLVVWRGAWPLLEVVARPERFERPTLRFVV